MHVFFITQWYPSPQRPLYGVFILEHARAVARMHKVSLLYIHGIDHTLQQPIQITSQTLHPNLVVYQLAYSRPFIPRTAWLRQLFAARQAFRIASQEFGQPHIIHANVGMTAGVSVVLGRLAKIPVVVSEHSSAYARQRFTPAQIRNFRFFLNRVDLIMPVCDALGQAIRKYGINRPMVSVQNVVDTDIFFPAASGEQVIDPYREITLIARLSEEKAVHLAVEAVARLQKQGIRIILNIVGDGPERIPLESRVLDLGLSGWVQFHGSLPKSELAKILRRSSALLLTSLWENQPVVILEALACGLPVLAPAIGGIPEVVNAENGLLFIPGDIEDLSSKLTTLLSNLASYDVQTIHTSAVTKFSPDVVGKRFDQIYRRIIENRHAFDQTVKV